MENTNKIKDDFFKETIDLDCDHFFTSWENVPFLREFVKKNGAIKRKLLNKIEAEVEALKDVQVWVRARRSECVLSLYDLYEFFLDSRVRYFWHDSLDNILVSTISNKGIYTKMTDLRWFNRVIYKKFVLRQLIKKSYIDRSFRISTNLNCQVEISGMSKDCAIHQITERGILFKMTDQSLINLMEQDREIIFHLPNLIEPSKNKQSFHCSYETLIRFNKTKDLKFDSNRDVFLYIPYFGMNFECDKEQIGFISDLNGLLTGFHQQLKSDFNCSEFMIS